jgi:D-glycero-alpha-D-manno-heptose-7-phosphate kinase
MIIVKSPFRISLFGGSTDYKDFYENHGSFLIGTTIDKHVYLSMRKRPSIMSRESVITYSQLQRVKIWDEIQNPLIREVLKHRKINTAIEFFSFSDIPARTGLGGSSSFCIGMLHLLDKIFKTPEISKKDIRLV